MQRVSTCRIALVLTDLPSHAGRPLLLAAAVCRGSLPIVLHFVHCQVEAAANGAAAAEGVTDEWKFAILNPAYIEAATNIKSPIISESGQMEKLNLSAQLKKNTEDKDKYLWFKNVKSKLQIEKSKDANKICLDEVNHGCFNPPCWHDIPSRKVCDECKNEGCMCSKKNLIIGDKPILDANGAPVRVTDCDYMGSCKETGKVGQVCMSSVDKKEKYCLNAFPDNTKLFNQVGSLDNYEGACRQKPCWVPTDDRFLAFAKTANPQVSGVAKSVEPPDDIGI